MINFLKKESDLNLPAFLDKDYLRLPTHNKIPLRKDWSLPINQYYKEPLTISQLLTKYNEYGIRLGLFIQRNYHLAALYFRTSSITHYAQLFPSTSYTQTENGLYYFLLIKELPPNCLLKDLAGNLLGNFYGSGKIVIGSHSLINNYCYLFIPRKQPYLTFNSLQEFLNFLFKHNLQLTIQGPVEFNPQQQEWFCPKKLNQRWKRRNFARKAQQLIKCCTCSRKIKLVNLTNHLTSIHKRKSRSKKRLRLCSHCQTNYSTLIKIREHQSFYCKNNNKVAKATKSTYEKPF